MPKKPVETMSREQYWAELAASGKKTKRKLAHPEFDSQCEFIAIIRHRRNFERCEDLKFIYSVGNGGMIHKAEAGKRRAEGILAGVPDIVIPCARHGFHGAYIENKSPVGSLSKEQKKYRDYAIRQGYRYEVCRTPDEQCDFVEWYLGITLDRFSELIK